MLAIKLNQLILRSNKKFMFRQCFGIPMSSPLSSIIVDFVLLERRALDTLRLNFLFYYR